MKVIQKHKFEAVSLLTTQSGFLEVTIIPVVGQPNWILPSSLILEMKNLSERIWTYIWRNQDVSVYHLLPQDNAPDKILVVEGNTDVHRLALQISGEIRTLKLKISELRDCELPKDFDQLIQEDIMSSPQRKKLGLSFISQAVELNGELHIIPDIDVITHQLVDLDS